MTNPATIAQWADWIGSADATDCGDAIAAARRILAALPGYRKNATTAVEDIGNLANALQAYALLLQRSGVTVVEG